MRRIMVSVVVIYSILQLLVGVLLTGVVLIEEMLVCCPMIIVTFKACYVLYHPPIHHDTIAVVLHTILGRIDNSDWTTVLHA